MEALQKRREFVHEAETWFCNSSSSLPHRYPAFRHLVRFGPASAWKLCALLTKLLVVTFERETCRPDRSRLVYGSSGMGVALRVQRFVNLADVIPNNVPVFNNLDSSLWNGPRSKPKHRSCPTRFCPAPVAASPIHLNMWATHLQSCCGRPTR